MSSAYLVCPVHFAVASTLRKGLPTTRNPALPLALLPVPLLPAINALLGSFGLFAGHPGGSELDCLVDLDVASTAANIARQSRLDLLARRAWIPLQQGLGSQQHSWRAITTLRGAQI